MSARKVREMNNCAGVTGGGILIYLRKNFLKRECRKLIVICSIATWNFLPTISVKFSNPICIVLSSDRGRLSIKQNTSIIIYWQRVLSRIASSIYNVYVHVIFHAYPFCRDVSGRVPNKLYHYFYITFLKTLDVSIKTISIYLLV